MNAPQTSSRRLTRMVEAFRWLLVAASFTVAAFAFVRHRDVFLGAPTAAPDRYHCPMHPQIRSPDPGRCPICSMELEPIPDESATSHWDGGTPPLPAPGGRSVVELTTSRAQQFGVQVEAAAATTLGSEIRTPVTLIAREGAIAEVRVRVPSLVQQLVVTRLGASVRRGAPMLQAFSEDIARMDDELSAASALDPGGPLVAAARTRLDRFGVARGEAPGARGRYTVTAPRAGVITRLEARPGAFVGPETLLYEITDVSRLLAVASVPSADSLGRESTTARLELDGTVLTATFDVLEPTLDPVTRRARARYVVENPDGTLLPGRTGTLVLSRATRAAVTVPRDAVVDTGELRYVFVDRGLGFYEPRTVELGETDADRVEVVRGLAEGERVVVRGGFLLDSESRLRAATFSGAPMSDAGTP